MKLLKISFKIEKKLNTYIKRYDSDHASITEGLNRIVEQLEISRIQLEDTRNVLLKKMSEAKGNAVQRQEKTEEAIRDIKARILHIQKQMEDSHKELITLMETTAADEKMQMNELSEQVANAENNLIDNLFQTENNLASQMSQVEKELSEVVSKEMEKMVSLLLLENNELKILMEQKAGSLSVKMEILQGKIEDAQAQVLILSEEMERYEEIRNAYVSIIGFNKK